jgi:hypothetical protein
MSRLTLATLALILGAAAPLHAEPAVPGAQATPGRQALADSVDAELGLVEGLVAALEAAQEALSPKGRAALAKAQEGLSKAQEGADAGNLRRAYVPLRRAKRSLRPALKEGMKALGEPTLAALAEGNLEVADMRVAALGPLVAGDSSASSSFADAESLAQQAASAWAEKKAVRAAVLAERSLAAVDKTLKALRSSRAAARTP